MNIHFRNKHLKLLSQSLKYALLVYSLYYIVIYVVIVFFRIHYPFELEWMEGGMVDHVRRLLAGEKLYVPPSLEFVPYIYPPLYFYSAAVLSKMMGVGFLPLRFISFFSSCGTFLILFFIVRRETKKIWISIFSVGLFAATFRIGGAWFDIARIDSLFLFLCLLAFFILQKTETLKGHFLAALIMALAFQTKQTTLFVFLPFIFLNFFQNKKGSLVLLLTFSLLSLGTILTLDHWHHGWYAYYVFKLPQQHYLHPERIQSFWTNDLGFSFGIATLFSLPIFFLFNVKKEFKKWLYLLGMSLGIVGSSWISRIHSGAYDNVLIPAYAQLSILCGISLQKILEKISIKKEQIWKIVPLGLYSLCLFQFYILKYDVRTQIPTPKDLQAGKQLLSLLSSTPGEVWIPWHGYLPSLAGKKTYAHLFALFDILRGKESDAKKILQKDLDNILNQALFDRIVLNEPWFQKEIQQHYQKVGPVFHEPNVFWPVTGGWNRPQEIYLRKKEQP